MSEMNSIERFFVNRSAARRSLRRCDWIRRNVTIPVDAVCLEIGCGAGEMAARFVEGFQPARYIATDLDPRQLKEAGRNLKSKHPAETAARVELRTADMLHLPFPDGSFDLVLAFVAIHHAGPKHRDFTNIPQALSEFRRVLRPGGVLLYSEFFHKEPIRQWLADHGFSISGVERGWRLESVAARKPTSST